MNQIEIIKLPTQSPDLSPFENLWHQVELSLKYKDSSKMSLKLLMPRGMRLHKK